MVRPRFQSSAFVSFGPAGVVDDLTPCPCGALLTLRVDALSADRIAGFRVCCRQHVPRSEFRRRRRSYEWCVIRPESADISRLMGINPTSDTYPNCRLNTLVNLAGRHFGAREDQSGFSPPSTVFRNLSRETSRIARNVSLEIRHGRPSTMMMFAEAFVSAFTRM